MKLSSGAIAAERIRHSAEPATAASLGVAFRGVRGETERRAAPLSAEDQVVQSMPDASPTKWHRAHTTWFFEEFVLKPHAPDYTPYDPRFSYLFNSYYVAAGPRYARPHRSLITRPDIGQVAAYRRHVDAAVDKLLQSAQPDLLARLAPLIVLGLHHEQQHQELMLTDILHAFAQNPIAPAYDPNWEPPASSASGGAVEIAEGIRAVGYSGDEFHFDNEAPAHRVLAGPVRIDNSLINNRDWLAFMADDGYARPELWLSDGWTVVQNESWRAPEYWREFDGTWHAMTLAGLRPIDPTAPVCHISYYEADAYARWAAKHLPTEAEWEIAAGSLDDAFGVVWQWTRSAYAPYPGYRAPDGAIGEYNGKFMINQMVLRGSSFATPQGHARLSYRNFFYPHQRWQFNGLRLASYD
jgi:ergothioneine biosynthesis protein EgtB